MASLRDERRGGIVCLLGLDRSHGTEDRADRTSSSLDLPQPQRGQRMTFRGVLYASDATDSVRTRVSPRLVVFACFAFTFVAHCYRQPPGTRHIWAGNRFTVPQHSADGAWMKHGTK